MLGETPSAAIPIYDDGGYQVVRYYAMHHAVLDEFKVSPSTGAEKYYFFHSPDPRSVSLPTRYKGFFDDLKFILPRYSPKMPRISI